MTHRITRLLTAAVLTLPATAGLALTTAGPALAAGSITSPSSENQVFSSGGSVTASATVQAGSSDTTLSLVGPGYPKTSKVVKQNLLNDQTASIAVSTGGGAGIHNGTWTVTLTGGSSATRHFITNFPVATPSGFAAQGSGSRQVTFTWTRGAEVDLSGYTLLDSAGNVLQDGIDPASSCSGSSCTLSLTYPSDNPGDHGYGLVAHRPGGTCSCALSSGTATASATLTSPPPPPPPSPTTGPSQQPSPSGGGASPTPAATGSPAPGGTSNGTGGGTPAKGGSDGGPSPAAGGTATAGSAPKGGAAIPTFDATIRRQAFAQTFKAFAPILGIPKLPPLPATDAPQLAGEQPLPQGTYLPTLPYKPRSTTETVATRTVRTVSSAVEQVVDPSRLATSVAIALLLLMTALHVRRFVRTSPTE